MLIDCVDLGLKQLFSCSTESNRSIYECPYDMKFGYTFNRPAELKSILKPSASAVSLANVTTQVPVESTAYKYTLRRVQSKNRVAFQAEPEILNEQEPTLTNDNLCSSKFIEPRAESTALDRHQEASKWHSTRLDHISATLNWSDALSPEISRSKQLSSTMVNRNSTTRLQTAYEYQESTIISRSPTLIECDERADLSTICHDDTTCSTNDDYTYQYNAQSFYPDSSDSTEYSSQMNSSDSESSCSDSTVYACFAKTQPAANLDQNVYVCVVPTTATQQGDIGLRFSERVKIIQMTNHSALVRVLHDGSVGYVPTDNLIPLSRFLESIQQLRK